MTLVPNVLRVLAVPGSVPEPPPSRRGAAALQLGLSVRLHAEGLQPLALRQQAVEPLHQGHRLVNAHLYAAEDGGHFIDFLDLLCIFGISFLALLHEAKESFHRQIHLFDSFNQSVLIKSHGLCTLVEVILVPEAELQHLLRIQLLQFGICGGSLATQQPFQKWLEGWNLLQLDDIGIVADIP